MKWRYPILISGGLCCSAWGFLYRPFPMPGDDPVLDLVLYHTPNFYGWIVRWYYAAPAVAVIVGGLFLITIWPVWFETWDNNLTVLKWLPPWPLSPDDAGAGLALRFLGSRLKYLAPLWQVILSDYDVTIAARFLGVSPSLVYAYVERRQIPHYRMMGRSIRFRLSELVEWRQQFHVNGGIDEQHEERKTEKYLR